MGKRRLKASAPKVRIPSLAVDLEGTVIRFIPLVAEDLGQANSSQPRPAEVLADGEGNLERVSE